MSSEDDRLTSLQDLARDAETAMRDLGEDAWPSGEMRERCSRTRGGIGVERWRPTFGPGVSADLEMTRKTFGKTTAVEKHAEESGPTLSFLRRRKERDAAKE